MGAPCPTRPARLRAQILWACRRSVHSPRGSRPPLAAPREPAPSGSSPAGRDFRREGGGALVGPARVRASRCPPGVGDPRDRRASNVERRTSSAERWYFGVRSAADRPSHDAARRVFGCGESWHRRAPATIVPTRHGDRDCERDRPSLQLRCIAARGRLQTRTCARFQTRFSFGRTPLVLRERVGRGEVPRRTMRLGLRVRYTRCRPGLRRVRAARPFVAAGPPPAPFSASRTAPLPGRVVPVLRTVPPFAAAFSPTEVVS